MTGEHRFCVNTYRVKFDFTLSAHISLLYVNEERSLQFLFSVANSGLLKGDIPITPYYIDPIQLKIFHNLMRETANRVYVLDSYPAIMHDLEIIRTIHNSDNYFLIATHKDINGLNYDKNSVFETYMDGPCHKIRNISTREESLCYT